MGRLKLKIKKLDNINARQATYYKRKIGIMKMAKELSILCDIDVVLLMFSPSGNPSLCTGKHSIGEVIAKFSQLPPQERAERKLENLQTLKRIIMRLDHDVNISEFLEKQTNTCGNFQVLNEKVRFLQTHLSEINARLSYWTEVKKIDSIDDLQQLENSVRQSLHQIRAHKKSVMQHQQHQLVATECKNQMQSELEANNAEVVQMKTKMTSLETQVESLTGIIQQLLNGRSNDPATSWTAYANLLNSVTQGRRDGNMNHNENRENSRSKSG